MRKFFLSPGRILPLAFLVSGLTFSGCDFGNKTNDTFNQGAEEGTIQEGDNADEAAADTNENLQPDTTGVGAFK